MSSTWIEIAVLSERCQWWYVCKKVMPLWKGISNSNHLTSEWRTSIVPRRSSNRNDSFSYILHNWEIIICEVMSYQGLAWISSKEQYVTECLYVRVCVNVWACDAFAVEKHAWLKNTHSASQRRLITTCDSASSQLAHQNSAPLQGSFRYSILTT